MISGSPPSSVTVARQAPGARAAAFAAAAALLPAASHAKGQDGNTAEKKEQKLPDPLTKEAIRELAARLTDAEDVHRRMLGQVADDFGDDRRGLGRSDVEPGNEVIGIAHGTLAMTWSR